MKKTIHLGTVLVLFLAFAPAIRAAESARVVQYSEPDIITIHTKVRFSTLIVLPSNEEILDFTTGDKDFWVINGVHNLCYVHPAQTDIETNLNLVTASGHIYSFLLKEISDNPNEQPDLKVFVVPKAGTNLSGIEGNVSYVRASEVAVYRREAQDARAQVAQVIRKAQASIQKATTQFRESYPAQLRFDYTYKSKTTRPPFSVTAIYHDSKFTYIKCDVQEKPTIYEVKDGKASLVNFDLDNGVYIIPEIVDSGYLAIGKKKARFERQIGSPEGYPPNVGPRGSTHPTAPTDAQQSATAPETIDHNPNVASAGELNSSTGKMHVLFEGTIIPTVLMNRLNGSFSGPVDCLVTEDVYSHDREHVLIPAGTKVLGEARKVSAFGQERLAVFFHRLIMPDGYSVSLDQFKGLDQEGATALHDKVNNHYARIFGASLAVGILGGIGESGTGNVFTASPLDNARAGFGESMATSGERILDHFLNILPTITIREGTRVNVYLSNDLLLPDYNNHNMPPDL